MRRRSLLTATPLLAAAAAAPSSEPSRTVYATGDGIHHNPAEYSALLQKLAPGVEADSYSLGGVVAKLEQSVATALGKEMAVWFSTGTLANHVAVRLLAGEKRRVCVQHESHLFNDCGDCCQTLSGLHMVPLAPGKATFTVEDLERESARGASGRVAVPVGALQIETPVRRRTGEMFDFGEMQRISKWARERGVGLHLDGARLYLASAYSGIPVREYAALFDTVYVSMYKYFNAASGAILAGPRRLLENLFHTRRMFGNGLSQVWPFAAVAQHYFDGFPERYARAVANGEKVIQTLSQDPRFEIERIPGGMNIFHLQVKAGAGAATDLQQRAQRVGQLMLPQANKNGRFTLQVNETWNRATAAEIVASLR